MKGPHSGDAFLQVAAGPDVSEEGHAVRLRFIRTSRNTKMSPVRGAEQSGGSSAETGGWGEKIAKPEEGQTSPDVPSPTARKRGHSDASI